MSVLRSTTQSDRFIVASCKPWHKPRFDDHVKRNPGVWEYVSSPAELKQALAGDCPPRYIFFLHWNWYVPKHIYEPYECVCFHMTDVPYGRGGSPLQNLILAGNTETMVTALRMVADMDAGPVYAKRAMSLQGRAQEIYMRAGDLSWQMLDWIIQHQPVPQPQSGSPTFFKRRTPEQSELPATGSMQSVYDFVRMLDAPTYPLAFVEHGDFRLEFSDACLTNGRVEARVCITQKEKIKSEETAVVASAHV